MLETGQVGDLVVGDLEQAELGIPLETGDGGQRVVGDVEFFEVGEVLEALDGGEAVGLDGEDLEVGEGGKVLWKCERQTVTYELSFRTFSSVILFLPSQSCSRPVKVCRFSISCLRS